MCQKDRGFPFCQAHKSQWAAPGKEPACLYSWSQTRAYEVSSFHWNSQGSPTCGPRTFSLLSPSAETRGLDAERGRETPQLLGAPSLSTLWLPVFLRLSLHEEGDSSAGSSGLLQRLESYEGRAGRRKEKERAR